MALLDLAGIVTRIAASSEAGAPGLSSGLDGGTLAMDAMVGLALLCTLQRLGCCGAKRRRYAPADDEDSEDEAQSRAPARRGHGKAGPNGAASVTREP